MIRLPSCGRTAEWILATRPWAFSASIIPILAVAGALATTSTGCDYVNVALALAVIVLFHAGTDVLSDCRDHESGVDSAGMPNGVTWIADGRFKVPALRRFAAALLAVGTLLGCVILSRSSWNLLWIGAAGLLIAVGYSFLKYRACGDLAVLFAFVLLPAIGVSAVTAGGIVPASVLVALPPGLLTLSILNANNIRDIGTDSRAGCRTLPAVIGLPAARTLYIVEVLLPYAMTSVMIAFGLLPYAAVGTFLTLPLAADCIRSLRRGECAALDRASARLQLLFGALYVLSFPIGLLGFWTQLAVGSVVTGALALRSAPGGLERRPQVALPLGILLAAVLWLVFAVGNTISQEIFPFASSQIDAVYALREGQSPLLVAALLLLLIGPAEELFWRGLVQRRLSERLGPDASFVLATLAYTLIHVWSFNFMLVGAAAVCGLFWGGLYRFFPRQLPALVVSHALWDAAVFVFFPIS